MALLRAMQNEAARARVFDLMDDPALSARVQEKKAKAQAMIVATAVESARLARLEQALAPGFEAALTAEPTAVLIET